MVIGTGNFPESLESRAKIRMPISEYFGGHGKEVMRKMKKKYGSKRGERIFYATINKRGRSSKNRGQGRSVISYITRQD